MLSFSGENVYLLPLATTDTSNPSTPYLNQGLSVAS